MWIFLNDAFLSIVTDRQSNAGDLLVRARRREDIQRTFPKAAIKRTPSRDYGWRATIPRNIVGAAIASAVSTIDYSNFKDSVKEDDRHNAYLRVWSTMTTFQRPKWIDGFSRSIARKKDVAASEDFPSLNRWK